MYIWIVIDNICKYKVKKCQFLNKKHLGGFYYDVQFI